MYQIANRNLMCDIKKMSVPGIAGEKPKSVRIFHDDTMKSFFRRLAFSPDGQILVVPAGCFDNGQTSEGYSEYNICFRSK